MTSRQSDFEIIFSYFKDVRMNNCNVPNVFEISYITYLQCSVARYPISTGYFFETLMS